MAGHPYNIIAAILSFFITTVIAYAWWTPLTQFIWLLQGTDVKLMAFVGLIIIFGSGWILIPFQLLTQDDLGRA